MSDLPTLPPTPLVPADPSPAAAPSAVVGLPVLARALDGLELFFSGLLPGIGASYLLVQQGEWAEWLAPQLRRITPLPVVELGGAATQTRLTVQPDHIYLLPPNGSWHWDGAALQRSQPHAPPQSMADFLARLAQAFGPRSAAAVLSGMDAAADSLVSAGLERGLRAVAQAGGRVLVQAPETAQYPQWPEAALATGLGTAVLSASELAVSLSAALAQAAPVSQQQAELLGLPYPPEPLAGDLQGILQQVQQRTGHDFGGYHWANSLRQIERRMQRLVLTGAPAAHQTAREHLREYGQWLEQHPAEAAQLQQALIANSTYFFRDPAAFAALGRELQRQLEGWTAAASLPSEWRAWVVGCSSGQEAYSVAMLMLEQAEAQAAACGGRPVPVQVFASDIDLTLLAEARRGWYSAAAASVLTPERRQRFFEPKEGGYQVRPELRRCLTFVQHGTFSASPLGEMHLLSCRNLLVYLSPPLQERVLATFAYALQEGGLLLLSPSEGLGRAGAPLPTPERNLPFALLDRRWRIYRRTAGACPLPLPPEPVTEESAPAGPACMAAAQAEAAPVALADSTPQVAEVLWRGWTPPAAVLDGQGRIIATSGDLSAYLETPAYDLGSFSAALRPHISALLTGASSAAAAAAAGQTRAVSGGPYSLSPTLSATHPAQRVWLSLEPLSSWTLAAQTERPLWLLVLASDQPQRHQASAPAHRSAVYPHGVQTGTQTETQTGTQAGSLTEVLAQELSYTRAYLQTLSDELAQAQEDARAARESLQAAGEQLHSMGQELRRLRLAATDAPE